MAIRWFYFVNLFETATRNSYLKTYKITEFFYKALELVKTDPFYGPIFTDYEVHHLAFLLVYNKFLSQKGIQTGDTLSVEQLLKILSSTKIRKWDAMISVVYPLGSAQYQRIFPHKHYPFHHGSKEEIFASVSSLSTTIASDPALAAVNTDVTNFFSQLNLASTVQQSSIAATVTGSEEVEAQRKIISIQLMKNYGLMVAKFPDNLSSFEKFFPVELLKHSEQVDFTGHLKPLKSHAVCNHIFSLTDEITLINNGNTHLYFYLVSNVKEPMPVKYYDLAPYSSITIAISQIGDVKFPHLVVHNPDTVNQAEWEVIL